MANLSISFSSGSQSEGGAAILANSHTLVDYTDPDQVYTHNLTTISMGVDFPTGGASNLVAAKTIVDYTKPDKLYPKAISISFSGTKDPISTTVNSIQFWS